MTYGRDTDIGRPKADTVDVNVKVDEAIGGALREVTERLDEVIEKLKDSNQVEELILGEEVKEE